MSIEYRFEGLKNFQTNIQREWIITNGLGGYCGSSVIGAHNRTCQGYLVAALHSPVERYLFLSKTNEKLTCGGRVFDLTTAAHKGEFSIEYNIGNQFLKSFTYDGTACFYYDCGNIRLTKTIAVAHGKNQLVISYVVDNIGPAAKLSITPLLNYRHHNQCQSMETLVSDITMESLMELENGDSSVGFYYPINSNDKCTVAMALSDGQLLARRSLYEEDVVLMHEMVEGDSFLDCHFTPIDFVVDIAAGEMKELSFVCEVNLGKKSEPKLTVAADTAAKVIEAERDRIAGLTESLSDEEEFLNALFMSADQFVVDRKSTGHKSILAGLPYDSDKCRDAMISFTGLLLETGRFEDAREVLLGFAKNMKNGLLVSEYPEDGSKAKYESVDAGLWYFYAVYNYLNYADSDEAWEFVRREIYPVMQQILGAYRKGTDYGIKMDEDGLLRAGSGLDQVTWMHVRAGDWVATPRHGKAVEVNALWYNAIKSMEVISRGIAKRVTEGGGDYLAYAAGLNDLAEWIKDAFVKEFWYEDGGYLYDVVDGDYRETAIRPNQIYAVSLPYTMLPSHMNKLVVKTVMDKLYFDTAVRTLDSENEEYRSCYGGSREDKERSLHQGTGFSYLLGGLLEAYLKVNSHSPMAKSEALGMLEPVIKHCFSEGCIGSVSELFDGDAPHDCKGCTSSAAAVGELIRVYRLIMAIDDVEKVEE